MAFRLFVLNLGGTSTKASVYEDDRHIATASFSHSVEDMKANPLASDQVRFRGGLVANFLKENNYTVDDIDAVVFRAPPVRCTRGGTYLVEGKLKEAILDWYHPDEVKPHGNRLGLPIIQSMFGDRDIPVYITDPDNVDEFPEVAHVSGLPEYPRKPSVHYLNQKAVAKQYAADVGSTYADLNLIIAHMGGGISITAHEHGRAVDSNDISMGWGPFSSNRCGTVPSRVMVDMCYDRGLTKEQVRRKIYGDEAGLVGHLGTDDLRIIQKRIEEGDEKAELVFNAMAFQIAKEIGSCYAVLKGKVDAILFTGGIAYSEKMLDAIKSYVGTFAPIAVYPGEREQEALALGTYAVLCGREEPVEWIPPATRSAGGY